jgi:hypothetical protein
LSSGESSWLQTQRPRVRFLALPDSLRSIGSGTGPLSLVSTIEELLGRNSIFSGLENQEYSRRGSVGLTTRHPSVCKRLTLTSLRSDSRSVAIVRSWTQATELWGVDPGRCIRLTTLPLSMSRLSRQCGIFYISQPNRSPRPVTGIALLYGDRVCFL